MEKRPIGKVLIKQELWRAPTDKSTVGMQKSISLTGIRAFCERCCVPVCGNVAKWDDQPPEVTIRLETFARGATRFEGLSPRAQVEVMRKVCQPNAHVLLPTSKHIERWDIIMLFVLVYTFFVTPFEVAFLDPGVSVLFFLNRIADVAFLTEMTLSCFTAYQQEQTASGAKGFWVTNLHKIRWHYCKNWLLVDLLSFASSFFEVLSMILKSSDLRRLQVMRVLRMARLVRLLGILKTSRMINRLIARVEISFSMVEVIRWSIRLLMVAHLMSCIWGLVALVNEDTGFPSWLMSLEAMKGIRFSRDEPFSIYCVCIYWALMTITSIGYGDIQAQTLQEYIVCSFLMLVGGIMWTQIIGSACAAVSTMDKERIEHEQRMDSVLRMCKDRNLQPDLRQRLRAYFIRGRRMARIATYGQVTQFMSPALRGEVALRVTERYLQRIRFLVGVEDAFVVALAKELELHLFPPNEWLVPEALAPFVSVINEVVKNSFPSEGATSTFCTSEGTEGSIGSPLVGEQLDLDLASVVSRGVLDRQHVPPLTIMERGVATRSRMLCAGSCWHEDIILSISRLRDPTLAQSLSFCSVYTLSEKCFTEVLHGGLFPEARKVVRWAAVRLALSRVVRAAAEIYLLRKRRSLTSAVDRIMGIQDRARRPREEDEFSPASPKPSVTEPSFAGRRSGWSSKVTHEVSRKSMTPVSIPSAARRGELGRLRSEARRPTLPARAIVRPALNLTSAQVRDWALSVGLEGGLAERLLAEDINGAALSCLTEDDLQKLGVDKMGPRKRIMMAILQLVNAPYWRSASGDSSCADASPVQSQEEPVPKEAPEMSPKEAPEMSAGDSRLPQCPRQSPLLRPHYIHPGSSL